MSFERWFSQQGRQKAKPEEPASPEIELPEGVYDSLEGGRVIYQAKCRSCDRYYELYCEPHEFTEEYNYCGGSPHCLP